MPSDYILRRRHKSRAPKNKSDTIKEYYIADIMILIAAKNYTLPSRINYCVFRISHTLLRFAFAIALLARALALALLPLLLEKGN